MASVYVLIGLHILHWKWSGKTLAPLELNEVMYTLELGIITAGFIFMAMAVISAGTFGRFFCSWGCHILALEDLCAWLLKKIGIKPRPIRARILLLVPPATMFYMFLWPQISRMVSGMPLPVVRTLTDAQGWGSYATTDFWRNLPGPVITILTFTICGFAIVYVLGSRAFCKYACPYGAIFKLADQFAPGRILARGDCRQCGICTTVCPSGVPVHEEINLHQKVVSAACMKDLECVSACPYGVLHYGFARPALFRSWKQPGPNAIQYDFTIAEESLMLLTFLAVLFTFKSLYVVTPLLMTLGIGAILSTVAVLCARLARRDKIQFNGLTLKRAGRLTPSGFAFVAIAGTLSLFVGHSAWIRYHEFAGHRGFRQITAELAQNNATPPPDKLDAAIQHLEICNRWGLVTPSPVFRRLASLHELAGRPDQTEIYLRRLLQREPHDYPSRLSLGTILAHQGRNYEAVRELNRVASAQADAPESARHLNPLQAQAYELLGALSLARGDTAIAITRYGHALEKDPIRDTSHLALGAILTENGQWKDAYNHLRAALAVNPDSAPAHYNLGVLLTAMGHDHQAIEHYRSALRLDPQDAMSHNNLGGLLKKQAQTDAAIAHFQRALQLKPDYAAAKTNLSTTLQEFPPSNKADAR